MLFYFFYQTSFQHKSVRWAKVNDPAPGSCGLYVDKNNDAICDLSETSNSVDNNQYKESKLAVSSENNALKQVDHRLGLITLVSLALYAFSLLLVNKKRISIIKHRKIWNWLLLVFFIPTVITSFFLALIIEFAWKINLGIDLSYWHFIFGWVFLLISLFHIFWHIKYYVKK